MAAYVICFVLIRVILPACLIASFLFRVNAISFLYLILALLLPWVKVPTNKSMAGATGVYLKTIVVISVLACIGQLSFQIVLLCMPPYAHFLEYCEFLEKLLRHIGFIRWDMISPLTGIMSITPDVFMLFSSSTILGFSIRCSKQILAEHITNDLNPIETQSSHNKKRKHFRIVALLGKYFCLILLCVVGVMRPSILNAIYFVTFLISMTWWASYRPLGKPFGVMLRCVSIVAALHIIALFVVQLQWIQELVGNCNICRYLGLTILIHTDCSDPRDYTFVPANWDSYLNPFALICLYYVLVFESSLLIMPMIALNADLNATTLSETTPLMRSSSPNNSRSNRTPSTASSAMATMYQDPLGSVIITADSDDFIQLSAIDEPGVLLESNASKPKKSAKSNILDHLISAAISIIQLINKSSYIATNIIMMAWSITYHSWLTFVLLLWASLLWMMPNQRRAMLRCSPFLVCYAIILLIIQYIYSMDLTDAELPQEVQGFNLKQIGLEKPLDVPSKPLLAKSLYTVMFWLTFRQYCQEKVEARRSSALEDMVAPLAISVGTATRGFSEQMESVPSAFMTRVGKFVKSFLTKFWIWVVAIMLFVIGISGDRMTVIRVIYMALFLVFILTFQLSYQAWRKILFGFWITLIIYSMTILVTVYTYQFDNFQIYWEKYLGIPIVLQLDIGLEKFETGKLFVRLLTPTFFLIITVIQLHYFHKDFLQLSDITRPSTSIRRGSSVARSSGSSVAATREMEAIEKESVKNDVDSNRPNLPSLRHVKELSSYEIKMLLRYFYTKLMDINDFVWLFLELHIQKVMLFSIVLMAIYDVCALNALFLVMAVLAPLFSSKINLCFCHFCSVLISVVLLAKMVYQIDYIHHANYDANCTDTDNTSRKMTTSEFGTLNDKSDSNSNSNNIRQPNNLDWFGFHKDDSQSLQMLLSGAIGIILVATIMALVNVRQNYKRQLLGRYPGKPHSMFPKVTYLDADKDIQSCIKYLFNYGFFKFGVEVCFIATVTLIATRMDLHALLYSIWLVILFSKTREQLAKVWIFFQTFIVIMTPIQYFMSVGLPPGLCFEFPWSSSSTLSLLQQWMNLPDFVNTPDASKLAYDFILLMFTCRQNLVFRIEAHYRDQTYPGGTNKSVIDEYGQAQFVNPVPDYITYVRSWLDIIKRGVLSSFLWVTLAIVFLAGTNRVNLFSIGYLIGSFIFLWQGEDIYLRPNKTIISWWNKLLGYNVFVIFFKTLMQFPGCVYMNWMETEVCWLVQLLGIACISIKPAENINLPLDSNECSSSHNDVGLAWDGICFTFLLIMRRIFISYNFMHQVNETKAMTILASRGAELIEELRLKQVAEQQEEERTILEKIKHKLNKIKETQQKIHGPMFKEPADHFEAEDTVQIRRKRPNNNREAIHSGDYYMFDEFDDDDDLDNDEQKRKLTKSDDEDEANIRLRRVTLGKLFETALKTDISQAADYALTDTEALPKENVTSEKLDKGPLASRPSFQSAISDDFITVDTPLPSPDHDRSLSPNRDPTDRSAPQSESGHSNHTDGQNEDTEPLLDNSSNENGFAVWVYIKFVWALIESAMISATRYLNRFSRDYRYVVKVLAAEKKILKDKPGFGERIDQETSIWQPPSHNSIRRQQRDLQGVPEIRVLAPSLERGLDSNGSIYDHSIEELDKINEISAADQHPIARLALALWYALISHSDIVCYFMVFLNQIKSATILSIPLPLMVFLWGTLTVPRPTKTFWVTIIAYTEAVVIIKCMFQFEIMPWNQIAIIDSNPFYPPRIIGIEKKENYAAYDLVLLLFVFFHRYMLKSLGLWKSTTDDRTRFLVTEDEVFEIETGEDDTIHLREIKINKEAQKQFFEEVDLDDELDGEKASNNFPGIKDSMMNLRHRSTVEVRRLESQLRSQITESQGNIHQAHVGAHHSQSNSGMGGSLRVSKIPGKKLKFEESDSDIVSRHSLSSHSVILVHAQKEDIIEHLPGAIKLVVCGYFGSMKNFFSDLLSPYARVTADVYAYMFICDFFNFVVVIFGFSAFGTQQGDGGVSSYLEENKVPGPFLAMLILQFALIIVDRALFLRKFILGKIVFQFILVVVVHTWMFFVLPSMTERQFNARDPPQMWYMVKCFYLLLSAYQIRCGYPTRILGNFLCKSYNMINMVMFKLFMAIPFLFELRALMDWIWTDTSMTLMDWLKMEDIFAHIFQLKCARRFEENYPSPRGEKKDSIVKYLMGGIALFIIIAIIWFPLVLFSLGNTVGESNVPYEVSLSLRIGPYEPIYKMSAQKNALFIFDEDKMDQMNSIFKKNSAAQTFLSNYDPGDIAVASLSGNSSNKWSISPPDRERLINEIISNKTLTFKLTWEINRINENPNSSPTVSDSRDYLLTNLSDAHNYNRQLLLKFLQGNYNTPAITLTEIFPKFLKVTNRNKASAVSQLTPFASPFRTLNLTLNYQNSIEWWSLIELCNDADKFYMSTLKQIPFVDCNSLVLYTFSDKTFPKTLNFISGGGIIGLYTTMVLIASNVIRGYFTGISFTIMFDDMPNVDRIMQLCLDIYLVRESGELDLEEDLFAKLVFLYRSPETLIKWTRPREEDEVDRDESDRQAPAAH